MKENDLLDRTFSFAVRTLKFMRTLPYSAEFKIITHQLGRSCTSIGANYEEAQAAASKADFKNKIRIALKEVRETNYWLRLIQQLIDNQDNELEFLLQESKELRNIMSAIIHKLN